MIFMTEMLIPPIFKKKLMTNIKSRLISIKTHQEVGNNTGKMPNPHYKYKKRN